MFGSIAYLIFKIVTVLLVLRGLVGANGADHEIAENVTQAECMALCSDDNACKFARYTGATCIKALRPRSKIIYENVALQRPAYQSSTYTVLNPVADKAVDGNKNSDYHSGQSCTHTLLTGEHNPWWRVDLTTSYDIHGVNITNRGDCCGDWLHDLNIEVSDTPVGAGQGVLCNTRDGVIGPGATEYITCNNVVRGRYVTITIMSQNGEVDVLILCEVEVMGN